MIKEKRQKLKLFEEIKKLLKAGKEISSGSAELRKLAKETTGLPKTAEQCQTKIAKLKKQIETEEIKAKNKEDNKNVALGTSKINYMDPRITISWCKRKEVQIEKIFPKTLRDKFAWAMGTQSDYNF